MRYGAIVLSILILLGGLSSVSAQGEAETIQGLELDWEYGFGETFISTKPLITNDTIFIRTSTSNPNSDPAGIYAFDLDGELLWSNLNYNSTSNDMSPITYVEEGQGDGGTDGLNILYNIADVVNKTAFGLMVWYAATMDTKASAASEE